MGLQPRMLPRMMMPTSCIAAAALDAAGPELFGAVVYICCVALLARHQLLDATCAAVATAQVQHQLSASHRLLKVKQIFNAGPLPTAW